MQRSILLVFILSLNTLFGQKTVEKTFNASGISSVDVVGELAHRIKLQSTDSESITIKALFEGEFQEQLVLLTNSIENALLVKIDFNPLFKSKNDKLSAHKLTSAEIEIGLPQNLDVNINGKSAEIALSGNLGYVRAETEDGAITYRGFAQKAILKTNSGNIILSTDDASITVKGPGTQQATYNYGNQKSKWMLETSQGIISVGWIHQTP